MTIHAEWHNETKTIAEFVISGKWNLGEFYAAADDMVKKVASVEHRVDILASFGKENHLPPNILMAASRFMSKLPDNFGLVIVVGGGRFVTTMANLFVNVFKQQIGKSVQIVATLDDAYALIAKVQQE